MLFLYSLTLRVILLTALYHHITAYPWTSVVNNSCVCGAAQSKIRSRIVGGVTTTPHIYPWMAIILNRKQLYCGGSIINSRYILTAGHCLKWTNIRDLSIYLGVHDRLEMETGREEQYEVESAQIHEEFASDFLHDSNDIALIKLKKHIKFNDHIQPICLPKKGDNYSGITAIVMGWGKTKRDGNPSRYLKETKVKVLKKNDCLKSPLKNHLKSEMLCAYMLNTDACQGDSGGPLIVRKDQFHKAQQIGVVSWGIGCAQTDHPGVYTQINLYLDWIKRNTLEGMYCRDENINNE